MKKLVLTILLLAGLFSNSRAQEINSVNINLSAGSLKHIYFGIGETLGLYKYNIQAGIWPSFGFQGNILYNFYSNENFNHRVGLIAGLASNEELDNQSFFYYVAGSRNVQTKDYINSAYGGLSYQIEYKDFFFQLSAAIGNKNFRNARLISQIGYSFCL